MLEAHTSSTDNRKPVKQSEVFPILQSVARTAREILGSILERGDQYGRRREEFLAGPSERRLHFQILLNPAIRLHCRPVLKRKAHFCGSERQCHQSTAESEKVFHLWQELSKG